MKYLLTIILAAVLISCGTSKDGTAYAESAKVLDALVAAEAFQIESDVANPMVTSGLNALSNSGLLPAGSSAGRINLIGNSNFLRVEGNEVSAYLPYYGERRTGASFDNKSAIEFDGEPYSYTVSKDEAKNRYTIKFEITEKNETYSVILTLFPNLKSSIDINSSNRTSIRYDGRVEAIKVEK
ncbi:DUF4251 domain-containing protein [Altibacter sp.]|uniref:DUF4251 domain-containing protein n=1 Tax=Altibacter sp. TaxID=2024823 RepID=UPI000C8F4BEC|nr:DUF4251 domain-containing protein [Altibacter sp.]MAP55330.1 hypothetical protein [Altibacter sp.]